MPELEGTKLGRYRLQQRLGRGGMSTVYLAYDDHMEREVAIKVVSDEQADYIERFRREAAAIGNLTHDHILPAFDYGEQGPWHYLVMAYMPHGTLRERLAKGRLTLEEAGEMLEQIASALQFAHDRGFLHRDIKPSNILLRDDHYAYLADFGLAKTLEGSSSITQTGTMLGTPEFMAPELSQGPASISSDIYALGVLLYQMVTGRVPFTGDTPISIFWKQVKEQPTSPSQLNPAISRSVEQVILRALEKSPSKRYQSAMALAQAYKQALKAPTRHETMEMAPLKDDKSAADLPTQPPLPQGKLILPGASGVDNSAGLANRPPGSRALPPLQSLGQRPQLAASNVALPQTADIGRLAPAPQPPPRRSRAYPIFIALLIGLGLLLIISSLVGLLFFNKNTPTKGTGSSHSIASSTQSPSVSATQQTTVTVAATPASTSTVIFSDSLKANTHSWLENDNCFFKNNSYHVLATDPGLPMFCKSSASELSSIGDAKITFDVTLIGAASAGMLFRATGDTYYDFEITHNGGFFFRRHDAGAGSVYVDIIASTSSKAIAPAKKNVIQIIASGADFKFYINGKLVGEGTDSTYSSGQLGFVTATPDASTKGEASFNNLKIQMV